MKAGAKSELRIWPVCLLAMMLACGGAPVCAQDYPSRSITVVVPFPAGGASDVVARIVTNEMAKILGQSMIIENVGGAGGTVGSASRGSLGARRLHAAGRRHGLARGRPRAHAQPQV